MKNESIGRTGIDRFSLISAVCKVKTSILETFVVRSNLTELK